MASPIKLLLDTGAGGLAGGAIALGAAGYFAYEYRARKRFLRRALMRSGQIRR